MYLIVRLAANVPMGKLPILDIANAYIVIAEGGKISVGIRRFKILFFGILNKFLLFCCGGENIAYNEFHVGHIF